MFRLARGLSGKRLTRSVSTSSTSHSFSAEQRQHAHELKTAASFANMNINGNSANGSSMPNSKLTSSALEKLSPVDRIRAIYDQHGDKVFFALYNFFFCLGFFMTIDIIVLFFLRRLSSWQVCRKRLAS